MENFRRLLNPRVSPFLFLFRAEKTKRKRKEKEKGPKIRSENLSPSVIS
jgi:hypothetical protein